MPDIYTRADRLYADDAALETVTGGNRVISTDHSSIHAGEAFNASVYTEAVADDGFVQIEFRTSSNAGSYVHMKLMSAMSEGLSLFTAVEAPTLTAGVTAITPQNLRRVNTPPTSVSTLRSNPTNISGGTIIRGYFIGTGGVGSGAGGTNDKDIELVLRPATAYLFRLQNLAGSAKALSLWLFWYEEPNG